MPDISILPANLATLVLESFLYGLLLLLFISTIYFLATRRTLAGTTQTAKHHLTSLVFLGVTTLFILVTVYWSIEIYQAFFAFIHLGSVAAKDAFYADLSQKTEVAKAVLFCLAILFGDALVTYRLWVIWRGHWKIVIFPIFALIGVAVASTVFIVELAKWERRASLGADSRPWEATGFVLSLVANLYSTACIAFRIWGAATTTSGSESRLRVPSYALIQFSSDSEFNKWFLSVLVESAALQTFWLIFYGMALLFKSDAAFIAGDTFPAVLGISNTLIHARVGLGWSQDSAVTCKPKASGKYPEDAV
ncbi:Aminotran-5 domain-containing protein [Mycena venus]|uniref:Aminotran-5 domain-containing protein n=1 Tax=Mycena venus TaxID=2733690 RepID=A0A8H6Y7Z9_9AGAR|nr:Aminotran-5 domain-containing protein [Mycena venus]